MFAFPQFSLANFLSVFALFGQKIFYIPTVFLIRILYSVDGRCFESFLLFVFKVEKTKNLYGRI